MSLSDNRKKFLIDSIRNGDSECFNEMYNHYFANVYSFSYKFLKSKELAQECTQTTFITIWEKRGLLDSEQNFKSYLFTICKNCILKTIEKMARENRFKEMILRQPSHDTNQDSDNDDMENLATKALEQLPPQRQVVFRLCKVEGHSYEEVAVALGISRGTVRDHMFKAAKAIKKYLLDKRILIGLIGCFFAFGS